jgi:predicted 2-oxoglutarate/Fe(II)-dependent dioxygenase YbiX
MSKFLVQIDNLLSEKECKDLIDFIEKEELEFRDTDLAQYYRCKTVNEKISDELYRRVAKFIPNPPNGVVTGLNENIRFSKYLPGQEFRIHKDGYNQDSKGNRSWMTLNIFLNDNFDGGETTFFLEDRKTVRHISSPKPGRAALFESQQFHCGNLVQNGYKYLMRTDVMIS